MKKNILTIIIMALTAVNLILTAVIVFTTVPAMNRTNNLIKQVSSVIDLELESPEDSEDNVDVDVKDIETHEFKYDSEATINLKKSSDGKEHWGQLDSVTLSVNKKSDDYKSLNETLDSNSSKVMEIVTGVISSYDYEGIKNNKEQIKKEVLQQLKDYFKSDFIIDISFNNLRLQ